MGLNQVVGYIGALFIGLVLGLSGGGGSILTVPVFVYILHFNPVTATAYSLFVVGSSAAVGAIDNFNKRRIHLKSTIFFAVPAVLAIFCTRKFLMPSIPQHITSIGNFQITRDLMIMIFFAILMILASFSMILKKNRPLAVETTATIKINKGVMIILGALTGLVTGIVGAGGGFMIVPILIFMARLKVKEAVGTSLFIIAINSLIGFIGDLGHIKVDWLFLLSFTATSIIGIFLGLYFNKFINAQKLKKGFGYMVLIMGIYIFYKELSGGRF